MVAGECTPTPSTSKQVLLSVRGLRTSFFTERGEIRAVDGVSFEVETGETVALVGESGCGKSALALSVLRLIPRPGRIVNGSIVFEGKDLTKCSEGEMREIRGREIGFIPQDPFSALNPVLSVGSQLQEVVRHPRGKGGRGKTDLVEMLARMGVKNPRLRLRQYPHELSGGLRQRVIIAMALACSPKLVIADEPTTSLDVTIQAQILELMTELKGRFNNSVLLITHNLGIVAGFASKVVVMYAGKSVEEGPVDAIYGEPLHPYTWHLMRCVPRLSPVSGGFLAPIPGNPPDPLDFPPGCRFHPRCHKAMRVCAEYEPPAREIRPGHRVFCWLYEVG